MLQGELHITLPYEYQQKPAVITSVVRATYYIGRSPLLLAIGKFWKKEPTDADGSCGCRCTLPRLSRLLRKLKPPSTWPCVAAGTQTNGKALIQGGVNLNTVVGNDTALHFMLCNETNRTSSTRSSRVAPISNPGMQQTRGHLFNAHVTLSTWRPRSAR